jgi:replicative DNA helicase
LRVVDGVPPLPAVGHPHPPTELAVPEILSVQEVRARITQRQNETQTEQARHLRYIRPLADAAEGLIEYLQNPEGRFTFGLPPIDLMLRGIGRGELCFITGRAHSGKTLLLLNALANYPDRRVLFFTFDEPAELVLTKLVAITQQINGETLEASVKQDDADTLATIRKVAGQLFRNLVVIDEPLNLRQMSEALQEAEQWWGAPCDAVMIDFLELLPGEQDVSGVDGKSKALKGWSKTANVPVLCLHQSNRANGARGKVVGMDSMKYAGDAEATQVLGVSRRRDDPDIAADELVRVADQITVNVDKNKRPPSKKGVVDFHLDADTGQITPLDDLHPAPTAPVVASERSWWRDRQVPHESVWEPF